MTCENGCSLQSAIMRCERYLVRLQRGARSFIAEMLTQEISVAQYLIDAEAPVTAPSVDSPTDPHFYEDVRLTLWRFIEHHPADQGDTLAAAKSLRIVHEALVSYKVELPSYTIAIDGCQALLADQCALPSVLR